MFGKYMLVFFMSMLPIVELRGAIPVGAATGLDIIPTFLLSVVGNFLPVPFILLFIRKILSWMKTTKTFAKIALWVEKKANKNKHKIVGTQNSAAEDEISENTEHPVINGESTDTDEAAKVKKKRSIMKSAAVALCIFVAVPLPGTGAWTGALIASLVDMRMKYALPAIFLGVVIAGLIMSLASFGVVGFLNFLAS